VRWLDGKRLNSGDANRRWKAALSLARTGDDRGVAVLWGGLKPNGTAPPAHIADALAALTDLRRIEAFEPAFQILVKGSEDVRLLHAALAAVRTLGDRAAGSRILTLVDQLDRDAKLQCNFQHLLRPLAALVDRLPPDERALALVHLGRAEEAMTPGLGTLKSLTESQRARVMCACLRFEEVAGASAVPDLSVIT
jgi:hypothetical protein